MMDELNAQEIATQLQEELLQQNRDLDAENRTLKSQLQELKNAQAGQETIDWLMDENRKLRAETDFLQTQLEKEEAETARLKRTVESTRESEQKAKKAASENKKWGEEAHEKNKKLEDKLEHVRNMLRRVKQDCREQEYRADHLQDAILKTGIILTVIAVIGGGITAALRQWKIFSGWTGLYIIVIILVLAAWRIYRSL